MKKQAPTTIGNRFEQWLIEDLKKTLDEKTVLSYKSGSGLDKNDINIPSFDIEIEAKNQKTLKIMDWWEQSQRQRTGRTTVMIFRNPRKPEFQESLVVMEYDEWKELVKHQKETTVVENNFDRNLKWKIKRLKDYAHEVVKALE